ncbi:MAG: DMT family transporter [Rhizobiaceae bacterium]
MVGSGTLGLVLYLSLSLSTPKLGATAAITLVAGRLLIGMIIDQFGLFETASRTVNQEQLWRRSCS